MSTDKKALKEALQFIAEMTVAYTNTLDQVAKRPFAEAAGNHMKTIVLATQDEPPKVDKKK